MSTVINSGVWDESNDHETTIRVHWDVTGSGERNWLHYSFQSNTATAAADTAATTDSWNSSLVQSFYIALIGALRRDPHYRTQDATVTSCWRRWWTYKFKVPQQSTFVLYRTVTDKKYEEAFYFFDACRNYLRSSVVGGGGGGAERLNDGMWCTVFFCCEYAHCIEQATISGWHCTMTWQSIVWNCSWPCHKFVSRFSENTASNRENQPTNHFLKHGRDDCVVCIPLLSSTLPNGPCNHRYWPQLNYFVSKCQSFIVQYHPFTVSVHWPIFSNLQSAVSSHWFHSSSYKSFSQLMSPLVHWTPLDRIAI